MIFSILTVSLVLMGSLAVKVKRSATGSHSTSVTGQVAESTPESWRPDVSSARKEQARFMDHFSPQEMNSGVQQPGAVPATTK